MSKFGMHMNGCVLGVVGIVPLLMEDLLLTRFRGVGGRNDA